MQLDTHTHTRGSWIKNLWVNLQNVLQTGLGAHKTSVGLLQP